MAHYHSGACLPVREHCASASGYKTVQLQDHTLQMFSHQQHYSDAVRIMHQDRKLEEMRAATERVRADCASLLAQRTP